MMRKLTWDVSVAAVVFCVLITLFRTDGFSLEGFKSTFFSMLIFAMVYAAIRVALVVFREGKEK